MSQIAEVVSLRQMSDQFATRQEEIVARLARAESLLREAGENPEGGRPGAWRGVGGATPILVIDLHDGSRAALAEIVRRSGFPVLAAGRGSELPGDGEGLPALIVFDPGPHFDSALRTVARMRIEGATPPIPIVMLSAEFTAEQRERGIAIGCAEVLAKPCAEAALLAVIGGLLDAPRVYLEDVA